MNALALCGSLRAESVNLALLRAFANAAPPHVRVQMFDGLRDLPLFNPDKEETKNAAVTAFQMALQNADAVVIACPEYAHGIPGAFKNALDWVVGTNEFDGKPTLLLCASARPQHAPAQLAEVVRTMGGQVTGPYSAGLPSRLPEAEAALRTPEAEARLAAWWAEPLRESESLKV